MAAEPLAGRTIGKYRLVEQLGRGGMAEVYKAYQPGLDRYVAIKLMHSFLAQDPDFLARFQREAKLVASLRHPNIVQVHDFDVESGLYYMVMEYIDGDTLKGRLQRLEAQHQWISIEEAVRTISAVGSALKYAHRMGMVHRDVKPANVMVDQQGSIILTDFGIAKIFSGGAAGTQLTATGAMVGTPSFMAPEQGMGQPGDERSDIYSLSVMLYQLVTGRLPYEADTPLAVVLKHINEALPMPRQVNPEVPEPIERIVLKGLAKNPDDRYQHVGDMLSDLRRAMGMTFDETPTDTMRGRALPAGATSAGTGAVTPFPTSARATVARPVSSPTVVSAATPAAARPMPAAPARKSGLAAGLAALGVVGVILVIAVVVVVALVMNNQRASQAAAAVTSTARALAEIIPTATETLVPKATVTATPTSFAGTVKADGAELRTSAIESGALVGLIPKNTRLTLRARTPDSAWYKVEASDGTAGWMLASDLDLAGVAVAQIPEALALIAPTATPNLTATAAACKPAAQVSDVSAPAGAQFKPGESFVKIWKLTNTGNCAWEKDSKLAYQSGDKFGPESITVAAVNVGASLEVSATMQAPQTPGAYKGVWTLKRPSGDAIGTAEVSLVVPGPTPTRYVPPTTAPVVAQPTATPRPAAGTIGPVGAGGLDAGYVGWTNCVTRWEGDGNDARAVWEADFVIEVHGGNAGYTVDSPECKWNFNELKFFCRWTGWEGGTLLQRVVVSCPGCPKISVDITAGIKPGKAAGSCASK